MNLALVGHEKRLARWWRRSRGQRGHEIRAIEFEENANGAEKLVEVDAVIEVHCAQSRRSPTLKLWRRGEHGGGHDGLMARFRGCSNLLTRAEWASSSVEPPSA